MLGPHAGNTRGWPRAGDRRPERAPAAARSAPRRAGLWAAALIAAIAGGCADLGDVTRGPDGGRAARADARPGPPDAAPTPDAAPAPDAEPAPAACTEGDARAVDPGTGHCYMYFAAELTWTAAKTACEALAGDTHLATIAAQAENALVAPLGGGVADVWLGGTDQATEGTWVWDTGEAMSYENWRTGEPNDGLDAIPTEDCMIMEVDNGGTWDDRDCPNSYGYYCERDAP